MSNDIKNINVTKDFLNSLPEEQIELLKNAMSELQKEKKKEVTHIPGRYKGETFWDCDHEGANRYEKVDGYEGDSREDQRIFGMSSKTGEEAEFIYRQQKAYLELIDKIHELNEGWTPEWKDTQRGNYSFFYNRVSETTEIGDWYNYQYIKNELYFKDETIGKKIIEELGEDLIKLALWGIE